MGPQHSLLWLGYYSRGGGVSAPNGDEQLLQNFVPYARVSAYSVTLVGWLQVEVRHDPFPWRAGN